ncbi:Hypothetical protein GLP15_1053 [Giardia lamblia P15]|uniref:Uncharacterized protein n=1 Tax=Giardia intestinalis (strain P15) TaxID=658858 RepID=E1F2Y4_GIAIA|nr:Hypothetical protein GLP15_1053 [Giardia lamblia P15]
MLPQADPQAHSLRIDAIMNQHVYWSGLRDDGEPPLVVDFDTLVRDKNASNEVSQSARVATEVFLKCDNILRLLDLAFPLESPSDLTPLAFDIFSAFPSNPAIMDACFNSETVLVKVFTLLHYYVSSPVASPVLNSTTFKGKQELIDGLSLFIFTGLKKQERLSSVIDFFTNDKALFDQWLACICNSKAQDVFLFFLTNYQTRTDAITKKIADLCASHFVIRNFVREVAGITLPDMTCTVDNAGAKNSDTDCSETTVEDKLKSFSRIAIGNKISSYTRAEACSTILATILRCNVPYLCDQIFDHYRLILDKYLFISTCSTNIAELSDMLMTLKICGQVVIHMLRYLVVQSVALHYKEFRKVQSMPQLSDEFIKERNDYFNAAVSHFIYSTEEEVKCTSISTEDINGCKKLVAKTRKYELQHYDNEALDEFEAKYTHKFITIVTTLTEALSFIDKCASGSRTNIDDQVSRGLQVASYLYLFYLSHAVGVANSSRVVMQFFDDAGDIDDIQSDLALRKIVLMEETSIGEFMWSDMYTDTMFSVDDVMNYNYGDCLNWKQLPLVISPFFLYSHIVRSNRLCTILNIMKNYKESTVIQSVGVRIISGIIELGVSLSPKNTSLLEYAITRLCMFYLKSVERNEDKVSCEFDIDRPKFRTVSYIVALRSIFREAMRFCTKVNSMMLMAIKYDYYAVDMDCLNDYIPDVDDPILVPRTFAEFRESKDIKYPKAHALLCGHNLFAKCVEALIHETDLHTPLSDEASHPSNTNMTTAWL